MSVIKPIAPKKQLESQTKILKPSSWLAKIDDINQLVISNNILISILGEHRSGKTSFANLLQAELSLKLKTVLMTASSAVDKDLFLQQLGSILELSSETSIDKYVVVINERKSPVLLIIDDAEFLPANFIEEILKVLHEQGSNGCFKVCLLSSFSLMATLNKLTEDKYPGMVKSIEVGLLTEQETKIFVEENLRTLSAIKNKITNKKMKQFFKITAGDIATVNRHLIDFFSNNSTKSASFLRNTGVAVGVFFASVLIVVIILSQDFKSAPVQVAGLESRDKAIQELRVEPILDSEVPAYTLNVSRQEINATSLRKLELSSDEDDLNNASVVVDKVIVAPKIINVKTRKDVAHLESNLSDVDKVQQKAKSPKAIATKDKSIFTIQILASNNQAKIEKFILIHNLAGKTEVHHINRQGLGWYVLTYGEFTNRQYAKEALRKLPSDIQQLKPWVRNKSSLNIYNKTA